MHAIFVLPAHRTWTPLIHASIAIETVSIAMLAAMPPADFSSDT